MRARKNTIQLANVLEKSFELYLDMKKPKTVPLLY